MKDIHFKLILAVMIAAFATFGAVWIKDTYRAESWLSCIKSGHGEGTCGTYSRLLNGEKQ